MYLLDSNILIYFFKNTGQVRAKLTQKRDDEIQLCTPVIWEILSGTLKSENPNTQLARLQAVQKRFTVLPFDLPSANAAAKIRATLELGGNTIGPIDTLIAGIAVANNLTLVTRNTREFSRVPDLKVENWYD